MAQIISIANHKGGVGKTTTTANLGAALANTGARVLLVDMDAQGSLTSSLLEQSEFQATIYDAMIKPGSPLPIISGGRYDIIPADIQLSRLDMDLAGAVAPQLTLRKLLQPIAGQYDYILIDCPPALGSATVNALAASHGVIITMSAEVLPLKGLQMLDDIISEVAAGINPALSLYGIVATKFSRRKINALVLDNIRSRYGDKVFNSVIRENVALVEAPLMHSDIFAYDSKCNGAADYVALANELLSKYGNK